MSSNSVGEIVIDAKLDNRDFMTNKESLTKAIKSLHSTITQVGKNLKSSVGGYGTAMSQNVKASREFEAHLRDLGTKAQELREKLDGLSKAKVATDGYKRVTEALAKADEKYNELLAKKEHFEKVGADPKMIDDMLTGMGKLEEQMDYLRAKRDQLLHDGEGAAFIAGSDTDEYRQMSAEYAEIQQQLSEVADLKNEAFKPPYLQSWQQMVTLSGMLAEGFGRIRNVAAGAVYALLHPVQTLDQALGAVISTAGRAVVAFAKMAGSAAISFLKRMASEARNAAIQLAKLAANAVSSGLRKLASGTATAAKRMLGLNRQTRASSGGMRLSLKSMIKYGLGIRSLYALFSRLRTAIREGFGELKKQNPEVKASLDSLSKALSGLKGSLATAFAPILTAVAPMLTRLINMLTTAINTIGTFFAALMGKNTVAKSIGSIGDAASSSGKKAKALKRELAGFDELNILNGNDSGSGGGGSGGGGLTYGTEEISSGIKDFVARLKELWANGEYEEIGQVIAEGVNKAFAKVKSYISWENVKDTVSEAVTGIAGVFNGLIDPERGIDFELIGSAFGEGIRTLINSINLLAVAVKWANLGIGIAKFFNGLVSVIDPEELSTALVNAMNVPLEALRGFVSAFQWEEAGTKFAQTVNKLVGKVDWGELGHRLSEAIHGPIRTLKKVVSAFEWGNAGTAFVETLNGFFADENLLSDGAEALSDTVKGLLEFGQGALDSFNPEEAAKNIRAALEKIDWDGIATQAWGLLKTAAAKLGDFITVLLGGDADDSNITRLMRKRPAGMEKELSGASKLGDAISRAIVAGLGAVETFFTELPWGDWGVKLGEDLRKIRWEDYGRAVADALTDAFTGLLNGLDDLIWSAAFGKGYKDNAVWKNLHPEKSAEYELEKLLGSLPNTESVLQKHGLTKQDFLDLYKKASPENMPYVGNGNNFDKDAMVEWDNLNSQVDTIIDEIRQNNGEDTLPSPEELAQMYGVGETSSEKWNELYTKAQELFNTGNYSLEEVAKSVAGQYGNGSEAQEEGIKGYLSQAGVDRLIDRAAEMIENGFTLADVLADYESKGLGADQLGEVESAIQKMTEDPRTDLAKAIDSAFMKLGDFIFGGSAKAEEGYSGQYSANFFDDNNKITKKETKETKKNTKELKKNTAKRGEVDVNYEGAGFDLSGDKPKLNVGVNFKAGGEGDDDSGEAVNGGLLGWLQTLLDPGVSVQAKVAMVRDGWTSFIKFLGLNTNNPTIETLINLVRDNFNSVMQFLGIGPNSPLATLLRLALDNASSLLSFLGIDKKMPIKTAIRLVLEKFSSLLDFLGIPDDSPIIAFLNLLKGEFDADADDALHADGKKATIFTILGKNGWTSIAEFVGTTVTVLTSLGKNGWTSIAGFIGTAVTVLTSLGKNGWTSIAGFVGTAVTVLTSLGKKGWTSIGEFVGTAVNVLTTLGKSGWTNIADFVGTAVTVLTSLGKNGWSSIAAFVGTAVTVLTSLGKNGWTSIGAYIGTSVTVLTKLGKDGWTSIGAYIGTAVTVLAKLKKDGWKSIEGFVGTSVDVKTKLKKKGWSSISKFVGTSVTVSASLNKKSPGEIKKAIQSAMKGISVAVTASSTGGGKVTMQTKARGGVFSNGIWRSIPQYAGGTTNAHGSVFIAGEAGPEIVGHVGGKTEVLNQSQLASAVYSAVVAGMAQAVKALGSYLANHMSVCTNAIVSAIGSNSGIATLRGLDYYAPAIATNGVLPYDVSMQIAQSTQDLQNTLDSNNEELIQAIVSAIGNAASSIITAMQKEGAGLHNATSGRSFTTRQAVDEINRSTLMYGKSPLKGVG